MQPYKIEIYVYAENQEEAADLEKAARGFVRRKYDKGILVTAKKILAALTRFEDNIMVNQFFR